VRSGVKVGTFGGRIAREGRYLRRWLIDCGRGVLQLVDYKGGRSTRWQKEFDVDYPVAVIVGQI
jgi:hypothetical protein